MADTDESVSSPVDLAPGARSRVPRRPGRRGKRLTAGVVLVCAMAGCFLIGRANSINTIIGTRGAVEGIIASYDGSTEVTEDQSVARLIQLMALPTMERRAEDLSSLIEDTTSYLTALTGTSEKWHVTNGDLDGPHSEPTFGSGTDSGCGGIDDHTNARTWKPQSVALDDVKLTDAQWQNLVAYATARAGRLGMNLEGSRIDDPGQRVINLVNRHGDHFSINADEASIVINAQTQCLLTDEIKQTIRETGQPDNWPYPPPRL